MAYNNIPIDTIIKYKILYKKKCNEDIQIIFTKTAINLDILCNSMTRSIKHYFKRKINLDNLLINMKYNIINLPTKLNVKFERNNNIHCYKDIYS